jgi:uncharacterized protein YjbI with pentapeptide repeats
MTTASTSLLGLALPVQGELSGTWGDTVNNSITSLVDSAVAGTTTISADADITLTATTLAANQARQAVILWTAGGTVTRNITAPALSKTYVVINKTSGTQSIVIRGAGPTTGVTVPSGNAYLVAWDGADFVKINADAATLTGTQTLTNKTISGSSNTLTNIGNASLTNSTISGTALGSNLPALTIGSGLSGTSYNGSSGVTVAIDSTVATLTGTQVLTNKEVVKRVVAVADGTSITPDADTSDIVTQANTQSAGTLTMNAPSGSAVNGQGLVIRMSSTAVQTFAWNAIYQGSSDLPLPLTTSGAGKADYLGFIYNSTTTKWQVLAKNFGF